MPYSAEISRSNPTCIVVLLDQSRSMSNFFEVGERRLKKAEFLADVANRTLHDIVIRCTKTEGIRDYYYVSVLGYGVGRGGVASALAGQLSGRKLVRISEVGEFPARLEERVRKTSDGLGGLVEQRVRFPVWIDPRALNDTPMCAAMTEARRILEEWLLDHPRCFPPVVLHISDGGSTDGDPTSLGLSIMGLKSEDGNVLLFNCHLSSRDGGRVVYPVDASSLVDHLARTLFSVSSVLPASFVAAASASGVPVAEGARGFVYNADAASLVQFFEIGTRVGTLR
jgi:hypothetical protein